MQGLNKSGIIIGVLWIFYTILTLWLCTKRPDKILPAAFIHCVFLVFFFCGNNLDMDNYVRKYQQDSEMLEKLGIDSDRLFDEINDARHLEM